MKSTDFCFWLQGALELMKPDTLSSEQIATIKEHLDMVFIHEIDPSFPAEQQDALNAAHNPASSFAYTGGYSTTASSTSKTSASTKATDAGFNDHRDKLMRC